MTGRAATRCFASFGLAAMAAVPAFFAGAGGSATTREAGCVVEQNFYFPYPGKEAEALAVRKRGSAVRRKLGLPVGRIFVLADSYSGHPASGTRGPGHSAGLMSEIVFESEAAAEAAHAALLASPDYLAVRSEMGKLLERFESASWSLADGACTIDR